MDILPTMNDLYDEPTVEELTTMDPWKAPGSDDIPSDLLQHCKSCLLPHLHEILVKGWREGMVPQNMCDAKIITRPDCNIHRRISLLGFAVKAFARVVIPCL